MQTGLLIKEKGSGDPLSELVTVDFVGKYRLVPSTQEWWEEGRRHYLLSGKPFMLI